VRMPIKLWEPVEKSSCIPEGGDIRSPMKQNATGGATGDEHIARGQGTIDQRKDSRDAVAHNSSYSAIQTLSGLSGSLDGSINCRMTSKTIPRVFYFWPLSSLT